MKAMALIAGSTMTMRLVVNFPHLYSMWDDLLAYAAIALISYGCGLAQGIIGILLVQYLMREKKPTQSDQTQQCGEAQPTPLRELITEAPSDTELGEQQPMTPPVPPVPSAASTVRVRLPFPSTISVGFGDYTRRFHNANAPCQNHIDYQLDHPVRTRRFTPCKVCYPAFYSR